MYYTIDYTFYQDDFKEYNVDTNITNYVEYSFTVKESLQDIIEYSFYKKYNKEYNYLSWYLEDGAKDFVHDIENKYWHNTLDTYELYNGTNYDFWSWMKDRYYKDALMECANKNKSNIPWYLDDMEIN